MNHVSHKVGQHFPDVVQEVIWLFIEQAKKRYKVPPDKLQYVELTPEKGRLKIALWQKNPNFLITEILDFRATLPTFRPFAACLYVVNEGEEKRLMYENEYWYFVHLGGSSPIAEGGEFTVIANGNSGAEPPPMNEGREESAKGIKKGRKLLESLKPLSENYDKP